MLITALTVLTLLSSVWALDSILAFQHGLRLLLLLGLVVVVGQGRVNLAVIQIGMALSMTVQAIAALLQFWRQDDLGLRLLGELDLNRYPGGGSILTVGETYWLRGYGLTPHPNILGGVLAALLLLGTAVFLQAPRRTKPLWLLILLLGTAGLLITFSRSAWLGGAVGGVLFAGMLLLKKAWRQAYGRSLLLLGLLGLFTAGPLLWSQRALLQTRVDTSSAVTETRSVNERQALAQIGRDLFNMAPLTGIGAANFSVTAVPAASQIHAVAPQPVHHVPRLLAAELGTGGSLLWIGLMLAPLLLALNQFRHGQLSVWAAGVTAALLALAAVDLFDYYAWGWAQGRLLRWLLWGLWLAAAATPPKQPD